jgi:integrase
MIIDIATLTPQQLVCPPGQRRIEYVDKGGLGLYLEVRTSSPGVGTYYLRYKNAHGKTCHQKIGSTAVLTAAEARREAKRIKAEVTLGADPRAEAKAKKAVITFGELIEKHYWDYVRPRKRSWQRDVGLHKRVQPVFGSKRLTDITRKDLESFHTSLANAGLAPATCDLHLKYMKHALALAVSWGMLESNPASKIRLYNPDNRVEHYLTPEELDRLVAVLRAENTTVSKIALFMLATGLRSREALTATYSNLDRERRILSIPASLSKSRKARSVPLSDAAMAIIESLDTEGVYDHMFINKRTKKPYTTIAKSWDKLRKKCALGHLRQHDLRHNLASLMSNSGRTLLEIQHVLGHADPRQSLRYIRLTDKTLLEAANSTSEALMRDTKSTV